ncbi:glycosyltransferase [Parageobacillus galactosidasius]|uniref:Glycosyl transferase family 1 domain-containing protein n=1 Tax=Parageobacillus galactosidasius TaxID=883812 RepID=A0A226QNU9_9BACL|nr:glycosyltransferase [Parageobacillus galactosidasius]OXB93132.1 hypothetical protein B9L23_18730 [Parageobacillus galactosidasius]
MSIDLVIFPFHDYKKYEKEGFRTRDGHLLQSFQRIKEVNKILVINRPVSISEMIIKKRDKVIKSGKVIYRQGDFTISQVDEKTFVLDIFVKEFFKPIILKMRWWNYIFKQEKIKESINQTLRYLGFHKPVLFFQNPLSVEISKYIPSKLIVFDAIDNWTIHPQMKEVHEIAKKGYEYIKTNFDLIFTNSKKLKSFLQNDRSVPYVIPNGVDPEKFRRNYEVPEDLKNIRGPIIGYAGKIQQRLDVELLQKLAINFPDYNIVIIGQLLDKKWFKPLKNIKNMHYLGDKHYRLVPQYVTNFDICIIPHNVGKGEVDGDAIKLYEYLAANKPIVTTNIGGVDVFKDYIKIAYDHDMFLKQIKEVLDEGLLPPNYELPPEHTWDYKAKLIINKILEKLKSVES